MSGSGRACGSGCTRYLSTSCVLQVRSSGRTRSQTPSHVQPKKGAGKRPQAAAALAAQIGERTGERLLTQPVYRAIVEKTRHGATICCQS
jgi:hypothetical protein